MYLKPGLYSLVGIAFELPALFKKDRREQATNVLHKTAFFFKFKAVAICWIDTITWDNVE